MNEHFAPSLHIIGRRHSRGDVFIIMFGKYSAQISICSENWIKKLIFYPDAVRNDRWLCQSLLGMAAAAAAPWVGLTDNRGFTDREGVVPIVTMRRQKKGRDEGTREFSTNCLCCFCLTEWRFACLSPSRSNSQRLLKMENISCVNTLQMKRG